MSVAAMEARHTRMMVWILDIRRLEKRRVRGWEAQRERRQMECTVRGRAVRLVDRLRQSGHSRRQVSRKLGASPGALAEWERQHSRGELAPKPRGRPIDTLDNRQSIEILGVLWVLGPFVGLPELQRIFPEVARAELEHRLRQYRDEFVDRHHVDVMACRWLRPGAVWAMDFAEPPLPIDGRFHYVFLVRDLGSGRNLLWLPLERKSAEQARDALQALFIEHGAPMVLKEDNDRAFRSSAVTELCERFEVKFLMSPIYMPRYNGACESGVGTLKTYTHHEAARHDRPGEWTCDDLEAARLRSNELSRPQGLEGKSPDEAWGTRPWLTDAERYNFNAEVSECRVRLEEERRREKEGCIDEQDRAWIERQAVAQASVTSGFLFFRRVRISPPFKSRFWSRIRR